MVPIFVESSRGSRKMIFPQSTRCLGGQYTNHTRRKLVAYYLNRTNVSGLPLLPLLVDYSIYSPSNSISFLQILPSMTYINTKHQSTWANLNHSFLISISTCFVTDKRSGIFIYHWNSYISTHKKDNVCNAKNQQTVYMLESLNTYMHGLEVEKSFRIHEQKSMYPDSLTNQTEKSVGFHRLSWNKNTP